MKNKKIDPQRWRDNNELLYSMRLVTDILGIRNIHIIARGKPPDWLDISDPRIFYYNEEEKLEQFANKHNFDVSNINVYNSEVCKYFIPYLENLHSERFILMDDDYFIQPIKHQFSKKPSTALFFNKEGIPYHPHKVWFSHKPIGFMTKDYYELVEKSCKNFENVTKILTSGKKRYDPFPEWCTELRKKGKIIPIKFDKFSTSNLLFLISKFIPVKLTEFCTYWHDSVTSYNLNFFFNKIQENNALFVTINDDWPRNKKKYDRIIYKFNNWLKKNITKKASWEKN